LSSGVERELHHAFEGGKEVYVVWACRGIPSPFITETATKVFKNTDEALAHFKSKGYDDGTADAKRTRQAEKVAEILGGYDLVHDRVMVCGDFNDTPGSVPLATLLAVPNLHDILELKYGADASKRWTYHYQSFEQIDFMLVSKPLKAAFKEAGVIRRGIAGLHAMTSLPGSGVAVEQEYDSVTAFSNQASDHGAIWAEFAL